MPSPPSPPSKTNRGNLLAQYGKLQCRRLVTPHFLKRGGPFPQAKIGNAKNDLPGETGKAHQTGLAHKQRIFIALGTEAIVNSPGQYFSGALFLNSLTRQVFENRPFIIRHLVRSARIDRSVERLETPIRRESLTSNGYSSDSDLKYSNSHGDNILIGIILEITRLATLVETSI